MSKRTPMDKAAQYALELINTHRIPKNKALIMAAQRFLSDDPQANDPYGDIAVNQAHKRLHGKTLSPAELKELPKSERIRVVAAGKCIGFANFLTAKIKEQA